LRLFQAGQESVGRVTEAVESIIGLGAEGQEKAILSLAVVLAVLLARRLTVRLLISRLEDPKSQYQWSKTSTYVGFVITLVVIGQIWLETLQGLGTFLGLLTAGLAIALRDLVTNMAGWAFILLRHPFAVGDRVQVGSHLGDVIDIRLFQFTLLEIGNWVSADQSTGRVIHVPNARVFTEPLASYTAQFAYVWHEMPVLVTFESDWKKAKDILTETVQIHAGRVAEQAAAALRGASKHFLIFYRTLTPKVYTSVEDSGVLLTVRFICPVRQRRGMAEEIWESILARFGAEQDIDFAYPTTRLYSNSVEGKVGARVQLPEPVQSPTE
jgi:small-conductance mechanosensitive channel